VGDIQVSEFAMRFRDRDRDRGIRLGIRSYPTGDCPVEKYVLVSLYLTLLVIHNYPSESMIDSAASAELALHSSIDCPA